MAARVGVMEANLLGAETAATAAMEQLAAQAESLKEQAAAEFESLEVNILQRETPVPLR